MMPRHTFIGAVLGTAAMAASMMTSAAANAAAAGPGGQPPAPVTAHVWVTTPDGADKLSDLGTVAFSGTATTAPTLVVDPTLTYQTMQGFGGAITDSSATVLYQLSPAAREAAMRSLFDPATGDGLDYLRQPIGASDFVATAAYTYDDLPAGQTDYGQRHFSIAHDQAQILPLLREAEAINPRLRIVATPWIPPAWMKTSGSLIGGRLIDDPRVYRSYALYLLKFIQAYQANGVRVDTITVQNEPQNRAPSGYPGTDMPSWQEAKVIEDLGPMLRDAGLRTQVLAYDHNWAEHPNDIASTPPDETADINAYPQNVLNSPAARWISGVAYHCYYGDPSAMTKLHDQFPGQAIYFTECSGSQSANPANTFSDTLKWHSRNLIIGATRNWAQTVINWNVALDPSGGPHVGGCGTCTGIITVREGDQAFTYTLPGGALATFTWRGTIPGSYALRQVSPDGWTATAKPPGPADPCCTGDVAANAVDGDASTRYSTGTGQAPGQYLQVDFGHAIAARQVVFDTGASTGDYPRGYTVAVSTDGTNWTTVVADGQGTGQLTTADLTGAPVRFVRGGA